MNPHLFGVPFTYIWDWVCTAAFGYLLFAALMVLWLNGPSSRIDLLGFLIPHASKVALWTSATLLWLRPRFGWRFPFAMAFLYFCSELLTNGIWVAVHAPFGYEPNILFLLSTVFFILGNILCYLFLKGRFELKKDWAIFPFVLFVSLWVLQGYNTEATIAFPSYWLETEEFIWNVLYVLMALSVFVAKRELPVR